MIVGLPVTLLFKQYFFTAFDEAKNCISGSRNLENSFYIKILQNLINNLDAAIFSQKFDVVALLFAPSRRQLTGDQNNPIRRSRLVFLHDIQLHNVFVTLGVSLFRKLSARSMHS